MKLTTVLVLLVSIGFIRLCRAEVKMNGSPQFAIDLYHQLDEQPGNLFFSPLSVRAALAMTSAGAKGQTLAEMQQVLGVRAANPHETMGALLRDLAAQSPKDERPKLVLNIANALWAQQRYPR